GVLDLDVGHLDEVAEPLLDACLHAQAERGGEGVAVGREDELERPRAEGGAVDALARRGEQELLDQVADVRLGVDLRGPAASVESVREVDLHDVPQVALTRGCTTIGVSGVPVGAHTATPLCTSTGAPPASTRVAPTIHCAVTHGPPAAGRSAQPATAYGGERVAIGWAETSTRGKGASGVACPPCAQMTVAPRWRMKPGIALLYVIVRAPLLMSTAGPATEMVAMPFVMMIAACVIMMRGL